MFINYQQYRMTFKVIYITIEMIIIKINIPPTVRITYKASYYNIASREKCRFAALMLKTVAMNLPAIT